MKTTGTIAVLLLLPLLVGAQSFSHTLLVGLNSSSTHQAKALHYGPSIWGANSDRWGFGAEYRAEVSLSQKLSAGVGLEYVRTRSHLYYVSKGTWMPVHYRSTMIMQELSLPLFLSLKLGGGERGHSYLLVGTGMNWVPHVDRKVEYYADNVLGTGHGSVVSEGRFDLRSPNNTAFGSYFRFAAGRQSRLKDGLVLLLELGFRRDINHRVHIHPQAGPSTLQVPFQRQWGYLMLGVTF